MENENTTLESLQGLLIESIVNELENYAINHQVLHGKKLGEDGIKADAWHDTLTALCGLMLDQLGAHVDNKQLRQRVSDLIKKHIVEVEQDNEEVENDGE